MMCVGHCEIKRHVYEKFITKNKHVHTSSRLENGLMYLYLGGGLFTRNLNDDVRG